MKKGIVSVLLFLLVCLGLQAQAMHAVTFGLSGQGLYTIEPDEDSRGLDTFASLSINYTRIFDSGFVLGVDMNMGLPVYSVYENSETGDTEEFLGDDFESTTIYNLYFGIGFAPVNRRGNWMTLTAGININLLSQTFYLGLFQVDTHTLGPALDWGLGFFITRKAVFSVHLKAGYNFVGTRTETFNGVEESESLDNFHQFFMVPSFSFGFAF